MIAAFKFRICAKHADGISHGKSLMNIPLLDLKAQYSTIRDEILGAVSEVLDSQVCILGPKVAALEERIAELSGCQFAVGVSSGTDAMKS